MFKSSDLKLINISYKDFFFLKLKLKKLELG